MNNFTCKYILSCAIKSLQLRNVHMTSSNTIRYSQKRNTKRERVQFIFFYRFTCHIFSVEDSLGISVFFFLEFGFMLCGDHNILDSYSHTSNCMRKHVDLPVAVKVIFCFKAENKHFNESWKAYSKILWNIFEACGYNLVICLSVVLFWQHCANLFQASSLPLTLFHCIVLQAVDGKKKKRSMSGWSNQVLGWIPVCVFFPMIWGNTSASGVCLPLPSQIILRMGRGVVRNILAAWWFKMLYHKPKRKSITFWSRTNVSVYSANLNIR